MDFKDKNQLRKQIREQGVILDSQQKLGFSRDIINKILTLDKFKEAKCVMSYISIKDEVETSELLKSCLSMGKRLCVPYIDLENKGIMYSVEITDIESQLSVGTYGILEPKDISKKVEVSEVDFIIIPGIAFDLAKRRLGRGAGYYDRYLEGILPKTVKCALCFDHQIVERVPFEEHDKRMDIILTPTRTIY